MVENDDCRSSLHASIRGSRETSAKTRFLGPGLQPDCSLLHMQAISHGAIRLGSQELDITLAHAQDLQLKQRGEATGTDI